MATRRSSTENDGPMRDRIVREAGRLFAEQGVKETTVAQLEVAVGLRKGSGGIHRYFATKDALVAAVFETQVRNGMAILDEAAAVPRPAADGLHAYLRAIGHSTLQKAESGRNVSLIALREGARLPPAAKEFLQRNDEIAYGYAARSFEATMGEAFPELDPDALAFLFIGPLIFFKLNEWLTGERKLGLDDDRLVDTWVQVFEPVLAALAKDQSPARDARTHPKKPRQPTRPAHR